MKSALIEDYTPALKSLAVGVKNHFSLENKKLPFIAVLDSTTIHFKPWSSIVFNPNVRSAWKKILEKYYESDAYKKLNEAVKGDELLSKHATVNFLNTLFKKVKEHVEKQRIRVSKNENALDALTSYLDNSGDPRQTQRIIEDIATALEHEAEETLHDIQAYVSFSHFGAPVAELLEKPDEFRELMRNQIIIHFIRFLNKLRREAEFAKIAKTPTLVHGRPIGVKKIQRFGELSRIIPIEYLDDDLLSYKIASRTVRVTEQYSGIQNYVVYLDKSGSMGENIIYRTSPTQSEYVPKISFAAASALALAWALKKYSAKMTLKLFDVEVHDPIQDFVELLKVLSRIRADSGTNITNVLDDAMNHRDERIIVVTDGIDEVSEEAIKRAKQANIDITFVFIKTDNQLLRKYFNAVTLYEARPTILLEV